MRGERGMWSCAHVCNVGGAWLVRKRDAERGGREESAKVCV